jgi:hypothetical protein
MSNEKEQLKSQLIEQADTVAVSQSDDQWIESKEFDAFLDVWRDLARYYESNPADVSIDPEVIQEYLHFTALIRKMFLQNKITQDRFESAVDALTSLEGYLQEILTGIISYLHR